MAHNKPAKCETFTNICIAFKSVNQSFRFDREYINGLFLIKWKPGPAFWGLINPEWSLCNKGRRQSPVNLEPQRLLFDPNLRPLHIDKHRVSWTADARSYTIVLQSTVLTAAVIRISNNRTNHKLTFWAGSTACTIAHRFCDNFKYSNLYACFRLRYRWPAHSLILVTAYYSKLIQTVAKHMMSLV